MPGPLPKYPIPLTPEQEAQLHPTWSNAEIARRVGCCVNTVKRWRQRWQVTDCLHDMARPGRQRTFTPLERAQITALACSAPREYGKPWRRWSGEKLAQVAVEQQIVPRLSPGTIRTWLRQDKIKPWRYHSWQHSTDPQFVEKAAPVLDLYQHAQALAAQGEAVVCSDEKTSIQARQRVSPTKAAAPALPVHVADRYKRMGAVQLFCALVVASGVTFAVKIYWLPTHASWLDQVEIIFSKVQRDVLTPNDFPSTQALEKDLKHYFADLNSHPKPIQWTYTKTKLMAKFGTPQPAKLAA